MLFQLLLFINHYLMSNIGLRLFAVLWSPIEIQSRPITAKLGCSGRNRCSPCDIAPSRFFSKLYFSLAHVFICSRLFRMWYKVGLMRSAFQKLIIFVSISLPGRCRYRAISPVFTPLRQSTRESSSRYLFATTSHQTGLGTRSMIQRPIIEGIFGRGRSGTSRGSNPAGLCYSLTHSVQYGPNEPSCFLDPNLGPGMDAGYSLNKTARSSAIHRGQKCQCFSSPTQMWPSRSRGPFGLESVIDFDTPSGTNARRPSKGRGSIFLIVSAARKWSPTKQGKHL